MTVPSTTSKPSQNTLPYERLAAIALTLYFAAKLIYFATHIGENIAPDEITWFGISKLFATSWLVPADSPASYQFGVVSRLPYLYFVLMGKLLAGNIFGLSDLVFLRLMNVCLGLVTVVTGYRMVCLLSQNVVVRLVFLVAATNTLMFTFLFAAVNYDNLTNCLAVLALHQAVAFFRNRHATSLLGSLLCLLLGCLTKLAFLPFAALLTVILLAHEWRNLRQLGAGIQHFFSPLRPTNLLLAALCLFTFGLNCELYGGNLIHYGRINPSLEQVAGLEAAMQYRIFARDYIVQQFKEGKATYAQAMRMTWQIKHDGDRGGAVYLLQQAAREKGEKNPYRMSRLRYAPAWFELMSSKIFGIMGHQSMEKQRPELLPYYLILVIALGMCLFTFNRTDLGGLTPYLVALSLAYALIIMLLVNYRTYSHSGVIVLALQGRYLFPVIIPMMLLVAEYGTGRWPHRWQQGLSGVLLATICMANEFPWFLHHAGPEWFFPG